MRPIEFRAWDKIEHEMVEVHQLLLTDNTTTLGRGIIDEHNDFHRMEDVELMQFTGIHGNDGKKIFEGDIVNTTFGKREIFDRLGCWFVSRCRELGYINNDIEVVGNIHENHELLESK